MELRIDSDSFFLLETLPNLNYHRNHKQSQSHACVAHRLRPLRHAIGVGGTEKRGVAGTEYRYSLRFQPKLMGGSFAYGSPREQARTRRESDMRTARPAGICGPSNLNRPSAASSSPGSVANLLYHHCHPQVNIIRRKNRKRTACFARSVAPGSHRGTRRSLPPRDAYRPRRQHGK